MVGSDLGDDVSGAVVAVGVEHRRGHLRPSVVPGNQRLRFDQQLAAGMRAVGVEVAELGHVEQFVVRHRWPLDLSVDEHRARFGGPVAVDQVDAEQLLGERGHLG